ncbi:MAG: DUF4166 domain-containing protein [Sphingobacteriales bacterium]|nr:MAG: DUF4166 domain-containing protein [Sphingobacteriales bacterium]
MSSLMHSALGAAFEQLPAALQAHYKAGPTRESGHLDIEYPRWMQPFLTLLRLVGALVNRAGRQVPTLVEKWDSAQGQQWRRTISFSNGKVVYFNSRWVKGEGNRLIEYVNPLLGLEMAVHVEGGNLYYEGVRFIVKLGALLIPIPEWLLLGHTTIVEEGVDANHFAMDFRLTHPVFGQIFRYAGTFEVVP